MGWKRLRSSPDLRREKGVPCKVCSSRFVLIVRLGAVGVLQSVVRGGDFDSMVATIVQLDFRGCIVFGINMYCRGASRLVWK